MKYLILLLAFAVSADQTIELNGDLDIVGTTESANTQIEYNQVGETVQICVSVTKNPPHGGSGGSGSVEWDAATSSSVYDIAGAVAEQNTASSLDWVRTDVVKGGGIRYFEAVYNQTSGGSSYAYIGADADGSGGSGTMGSTATSFGYRSNGRLYNNGSYVNKSSYGFGDVVRIWYKGSTGEVWVGVNGSVDGDPANELTPSTTMFTTGLDLEITAIARYLGQTMTIRTVASDFAYSALGATPWGD